MENGFVYLDEFLPGVKWDAKYAGNDNFMGRPADGYFANRIVLHRDAAEAFKGACAVFKRDGFTPLVFDAYRPARAVADFLKWMEEDEDVSRKAVQYPNIDKKDMVALGYIARRSGHSRGSTIDLTLLDDKTGRELDMGGCFDFMDEISHTRCPAITPLQLENRLYLRRVMTEAGFDDYHKEWWHFRLMNEAFPDTYFDFPIV